MRNSNKKTAVVMLTMAAFLLSTVGEAQARIGSASSAGSARPAVTGFKLRSTSSASSSSSSRLGGGSSMGMSRSGVMNNVRSQPAPAPSYAQSYRPAPAPVPVAPAPSPSPASPSKRSWVAPAVAGVAAGALAGYALGHSNSQPQAPAPQYQQPAPQYQQPAPQYQQAPADAPAYSQAAPAPSYNQAPAYASTSHSSGGFGFGSFLILALLIAAGIFAYRRYVMSKGDIKADALRTGNAAHAAADAFKSAIHTPAPAAGVNSGTSVMTSAQAGQDLMAIAKQFYLDLQTINNQGDLATLRNRVGDDGLYQGLADDIHSRTQASQTEVISVTPSLVDITDEGNRFVGSVRYQGQCKEAPFASSEDFDEVFHFIKDKGITGGWKLAGIEQVEQA